MIEQSKQILLNMILLQLSKQKKKYAVTDVDLTDKQYNTLKLKINDATFRISMASLGFIVELIEESTTDIKNYSNLLDKINKILNPHK